MTAINNIIRTFFFIFVVIYSFSIEAQTSVSKNKQFQVNPFQRKAFIENKGQFKAELPDSYQNFEYCIDNGAQILFTKEGLTHVVKKINHKKMGALAIFMSEEKRELLEHEVDVEHQYINMKWLNANVNATLEVSDEQITTYNYFLLPQGRKNYTETCKGYQKLTYKNLYDGIDVEYFFTEKDGFKYNLIVSEGADLSQVKMQYDAKTKLEIREGNIIIKTIKGNVIDHAPITYLTNNSKEIIPSVFAIKNNIISFVVNNPGKQAITIDPWTLTPLTANPAYDNGLDGTGNVYLSGGTAAGYYVEKFTPLGVPIWSMLSPVTGYYGDMLVEPNGNFYVSEGFNAGGARTFKFGPTSAPIWTSTTPGGGFREHWRLALNCITNKVIVAGGGTTLPTDNIAEIDVNTGTLINIIKLYGGGSHDMSGLCVDETGKSYVHDGISNQIVFTDAANNPLSYSNSGYTHTETFSWYSPGEGHGYNMMALGGTTFLFTSDGLTLSKWDRNTYALLGSVAIPGGQPITSCGILADKCNNLFVGSNLGVYRYDFNLVQKEFKATTAPVYDIAYAPNSDIIACGVGYATSLPFGRETCGTLQTIITSNPCNPSINTVTIRPIAGTAPFTFLWDDGSTDSTRVNLGPGKHVVVVKDGSCIPQFTKDTIEFKATKAIRAIIKRPCFSGSNGQLQVWLTQGQKIISYTITPSITNSQINDSTILGTGLANGSYSFQLVSDLGCSLDTVITLTQYPAITTSVQAIRRAVCPGQATGSGSVTVQGGGVPYTAATSTPYTLSWNTIPFQTTGIINGVIEGTYVVTITDSVGCTKKDSVLILANPIPQVSFASDTVCLGKATTFIDKTTIAMGSLASWAWAFGGTSTIPTPTNTIQNPTFVYDNCGAINNATLVVTSDSGCVGNRTSPVIMRCLPVPSFSFNNNCKNEAVQFNNSSTNGLGTTGNLNYLWNLNPTNSALQNPINTYTTAGIRSVSLTVTDQFGCIDSLSQSITIYELPTASFTSDSVCLGSASQMTDNSTGNGNVVNTYTWDFLSDGSVDVSGISNPNFTFPSYGNNNVSYTVSTSPLPGLVCSNTTNSIKVWVNPNPIPDFTFVNACVNAQPNMFDASSSTIAIGTNASYLWAFGDGGVNSSPSTTTTHTYAAAGVYQTTLVTTSNKGCQSAVTKQVEVYEKPYMTISATPAVCLGASTNFTANSLSNSGPVNQWLWDMNSNFTNIEANGQQTSFVFTSAGTKTVRVIGITTNGCRDTVTRTTYINYNPDPQFLIDKPSGCPLPHCVTFSDNTPVINGPAQINNWVWSFGDGNTNTVNTNASQQNCYTNSSSSQLAYFTVSLKVTTDSSCSAVKTQTNAITVYPKPIADYVVDLENGTILQPLVHFTNQSQDYTKWWWYYGDLSPLDSLVQSPTHSYDEVTAQTYATYLIVSNQYRCKDTAYMQVEIGPEFVFYIPNAFSPNDDGVNDFFTGKGIGIEKFELWVFDRWGEMICYSDDITKGWDGKVQGKSGVEKQDVYIWKVKLKDVLGKKHEYVGHVTLLR